MSGKIRVRNWEKFQHYRDRNPPWIKLYNDLLEDYEFGRLQDASKAHLIAIWLLASRTGNELPADPEWIAGKIGATEPVNLSTLVSAGFLEAYGDASKALAESKQSAIPEREGETEAETPTVHKRTVDEWPVKPKKESGQYLYPSAFEAIWEAYPSRSGSNPKVGAYKAVRARVKAGDDPADMQTAARHYRAHMEATEKDGTEFVAQAATFFGPSEPWREFVDGSPNGKPKHWSESL